MKTLYLLRHAERENSTDFDTPLTENGHKQAQKLGRYIQLQTIEFDMVLCSSALRTRQTYEGLDLSGPAEFKDEIFTATPGDLLAMVQQLKSSLQSCLIIGHNPALPLLAQYFTTPKDQTMDALSMPPCALKNLELPAATWKTVQPGSAALTHLFP